MNLAHLHPAVVHFPIALLLVGVVADVVRPNYEARAAVLAGLGLWCTTLGLLGLLPAIGTGLLAYTFQPAPSPEARELLDLHEWLSYLQLILFAALVIWRWDARGENPGILPIGYRAVAVCGAVLILASGFSGGQLVFRHAMGVESVVGPGSASSPSPQGVLPGR